MSRIKILENDREIPLSSAFYLKTTGTFNFFLTIDIRGNPRSTGSSLMIFAYSKPDRTNIIATEFAYRRIKNSQTEKINNRSNCFRCGVKDIQSYIEVILRPIEEDYQGEIKVVYGPIELDNMTKDKYIRAKSDPFFQIECHGKADNKIDFTLLCFEKDFIIAKDSNLKEIKKIKIVPEMMVVSNSVYPQKLKILLPALNSELAVEFDQVRDKDVALLLLEHKKKMVAEGKSNLLRNPKLPDHFRIEKTSNNHLMLGKDMGKNSFNETFMENIHSLNDMIKESTKEKSVKNTGNPQRTTRVVIKQVNSRDEIKETKEGSYKNRMVRTQSQRSSDNIITFNPNAVPEQKKSQKPRSAKKSNHQDPLVLKNPYHSSAQKRYLFKTKENDNILDAIDEVKQNKRKPMHDISEELLNFDGLSEHEMDKMINQVFKKENVEVQKYGRAMKDSLPEVYQNKKKVDDSNSFFDDVDISKNYHEIPVQNFKKNPSSIYQQLKISIS